ncbi:hypothetical protein IGI37_000014 [Enterococcus sp. AZ194]|uniref:HIT family protein n=1 Tax=Enterococcus sp. AZ194 TaxID=2774629 RepID=UPI003F24B279
MEECIFCNKNEGIVLENKTCVAFFDNHPVAQGHVLIIPREHKVDYFELLAEEIKDMNELLHTAKEFLDAKYLPDGYNIGLNCGEVAGQSVFHCHCHIIPRYKNDTPSPKGGVRGVIPERMAY